MGRVDPEMGFTVNPIQIRGADYAHCITDSPPEYQELTTSLHKVDVCPKINSRRQNFLRSCTSDGICWGINLFNHEIFPTIVTN